MCLPIEDNDQMAELTIDWCGITMSTPDSLMERNNLEEVKVSLLKSMDDSLTWPDY